MALAFSASSLNLAWFAPARQWSKEKGDISCESCDICHTNQTVILLLLTVGLDR